MLTVLSSSGAGSRSAKSSKRLPRDSASMRTNVWLSFFHRMRFFPEREKQNERYVGNVGLVLSKDVTDSMGREGLCVIVADHELMKRMKRNKRANFDLLIPSRIEGSI